MTLKQNMESQVAQNFSSEKRHLTVTERYFKPKYFIGSKDDSEKDLCILTHSNRICILTLAKFHPILREKKKIKCVNFDVDGINRLENKVSGKGKRGAQWLNPKSKICIITCENGEEYTINCGIRSQLIEVNENLVDEPDLLTNKPQSDGFIAIVLPKLNEYDQVIKKLKSEEDYMTQRCDLTSDSNSK